MAIDGLMTDHELEQVRTALTAAIQVPQENRIAVIRELCSGDRRLISEVEELLGLHESAGDFLNRSLPELFGATAAAFPELDAGTLLKDRYRLEQRIARSDFATVYFAADQLLGEKRVVIKVLDRLQDDAALKATFDSELRSLSRVQHPNVVGITDVGTLDDGKPFLVLTYVPGITLREVIRRGPTSKTQVRSIVQGVGRALSAAHSADVWHLDLKPENIIVTGLGSDDERITLIDFGIARFKNSPNAGLNAGSPRYMAPEQRDHPSAQCDIYSLSLIAFELFTGHLPSKSLAIATQFPRELEKTTIAALVTGQSTRPSERFAEVSQFVEALQGKRKTRSIAAMSAAIVGPLIFVAAGYVWLIRTEVQQFYTKPVPIVSTPAREHQPVFSPDGSEVYYTVGPDYRQDIYKKAIAGGDPVLVVGNLADDVRPRISPDGKQITFVRDDDHKTDLILKDLSNGREEVLAAGIDVDTHSWTPDGKRLVLSGISADGLQKLRVLEIASKKIIPLELQSPSDCGKYHPRVSPDGHTLAFACRWFQGSDDLFVTPIDSDLTRPGKVRRVTRTRDRIDSLEWAPDGQSLFYVSGPLGNGSVLRVFLNRQDNPFPLPGLSGQIASIAIPLKSWKLAFSHYLSDTNIWRYDSNLATPARRVVASSYEDEEGSLSSDGRLLLFDSERSGKSQMWVAGANGENARQLTNFESVDGVGGFWAADKIEAIISARSKDLGERVYRLSVEGQSSLIPVIQGAMATSISRDGRSLYIVKSNGAERTIFRTQYPEAKTTELIAKGGAYGVESADGRSFYFAKREPHEGIWRQNLPRGPVTQVVSTLHRRDLFAVGRKGIFFIAPTPRAEFPSLFFQGFQTKITQKLFSFGQEIGWGLDLSPDERTLLLSQVDIGNSDIMLIERFR